MGNLGTMISGAKNVFIDSETCGLHGMPVLLQYAEEDGPIHLHEVWKEPVGKTLELIEYFCRNYIIGFNLSFDWFHLTKLQTIWSMLAKDTIPENCIDLIGILESKGCDGPCIKPVAALDLLLHSRKGPYQSLMDREDIRIRRVPTALAYALAQELESRVNLDGIYFARFADKDAPKWRVYDIVSKNGIVNRDFKDVVLKFAPAGGLKFLAEYALKIPPKYHYEDIEVAKVNRPVELGYAPYAVALSNHDRGWSVADETGKLVGFTWPGVIPIHIKHWHENEPAREYASDDIVYTRKLYEHFERPPVGDDDSELAIAVASIRWHGFEYDRQGLLELRAVAENKVKNSPVNPNKPSEVRDFVAEMLEPIELELLLESTKKANLEQIQAWRIEEREACSKCNEAGCTRCGGKGYLEPGPHPAAQRAKEILDIKIANKEIELYDKLLSGRRFHPSFKVIGTLSSRMAGADGLNPQAIKKGFDTRSKFTLKTPGNVLSIGDFSSFEVTLADAVFNDPDLRQTLIEGKKVHALLGVEMFPGHTYEEIIASESQKEDFYTKGKQGFFGFLYGGDDSTWTKKLGIPADQAKRAYEKWCAKYPGIGKARMRIYDAFCSMRQPGGIGSAVVWHEPDDYCETALGFRRYFTLENMVCKTLFELANKPPKSWQNCPFKVVRRDREQSASGAVQSALYGCAFQIQAANMRAANNHLIQSFGATITKAVQRRIWDLQPAGVHPLYVSPTNIHDEIFSSTHPDFVEPVAEVVRDAVESFRPHCPLIGLDWVKDASSWADKHGSSGSGMIKIRAPKPKV